MPLAWITINEKLSAGVSLINNISTTKFSLLLKQITSEDQFTDDELEKLRESFGLNDANLQLLLLSVRHIWKQSLKVLIKPTTLHEQLTKDLGLNNDKTEEFIKLWTNRINNDFDLNRTKYLDHISWELNVETCKIYNNQQLKPTTRLQLSLNEPTSDNSDNNDKVMLELDQDELLHFYNILENVQNKLDALQ